MMGRTRASRHDSPRAWLCVFGASLALFCTVGFLNSFGVFQAYYKEHLQGKSESDISWIGTVSIFLLYIGAPITGILVDKVGPTILLCCGSVGELLALFMTALCTKYYQLFLAQSILLGASMSFIFCPPLAVVSRRLPHRRGLALGLAIGGSSIGGIIWPIMLERLLNSDGVGFPWTMRAVAFTMLPLLAIACATIFEAPAKLSSQHELQSDVGESSEETMHPATESKAAPKTDLSILKKWEFILLCVGFDIIYLGLFLPLFYVSTYAMSIGISTSTAFYLLSAVNGASFLGRVLPGYMADRYGYFNLCILMVLASGVISFCWTAVSSLAGIIVWSLAFGFASGAVISLQGACAGKTADHKSQGTAIGFLMGSASITALVGAPIGGQLLGQFGYFALSMFTGATLVVGSVFLIAARLRIDRNILSAH